MEKHLDILIVHDDPVEAVRLVQELDRQKIPCESRCVPESGLLQALEERLPDVILFDSCHGSCDSRGFAALDLTQDHFPGLPFVFVSGSCDPRVQVEVIASGAAGCVYRGHLEDLRPVIEEALDDARTDRGIETALVGTPSDPEHRSEPVETLQFCGCCRLIRTAAGQWEDLEAYLRRHERAVVTLSICPTCQEMKARSPVAPRGSL